MDAAGVAQAEANAGNASGEPQKRGTRRRRGATSFFHKKRGRAVGLGPGGFRGRRLSSTNAQKEHQSTSTSNDDKQIVTPPPPPPDDREEWTASVEPIVLVDTDALSGPATKKNIHEQYPFCDHSYFTSKVSPEGTVGECHIPNSEPSPAISPSLSESGVEVTLQNVLPTPTNEACEANVISPSPSDSDVEPILQRALPTHTNEAREANAISPSPSDSDVEPILQRALPTHTNEACEATTPHLDEESCIVADKPCSEDTISLVISTLQKCLPPRWTCYKQGSPNGIYVMMMSPLEDHVTVQRQLTFYFDGNVSMMVHNKRVSSDVTNSILAGVQSVPLFSDSTLQFIQWVLSAVQKVREMEICVGANAKEYEPLWLFESQGYVDTNVFMEVRYSKTCRSNVCTLLVNSVSRKCIPCIRLQKYLKRKISTHSGKYNPNTSNIWLTEEEKLQKLEDYQKERKSLQAKLDRQTQKIECLLKEKGVDVDNDLSDFLSEALRSAKMTEVQQLFLQQQIKSATVKGPTGMRWHPTLVRFALHIKTISSAAYSALRESGLITLPSERTLFDYSHIDTPKEGISKRVLDKIHQRLQELADYQAFHILMFDEMYISQKLVYRKSTNELVGYVDLQSVEQEMKALEDAVTSAATEEVTSHRPPLPKKPSENMASKMLTFMVKGTANNVKDVVASYSVSLLTSEALRIRTWHVITYLERAGIHIVALVCDGSSVNRGFIDMHRPITKLPSGVKFDTINRASTLPGAERHPLFFISDPPHLLKTIRNSFASSGTSPKSKRLLTINGQTIEWSTIIRLYKEDKNRPLRRCHKLNAVNVYLNSYSCMKVSYAAQVLSATVAKDLKDRASSDRAWKGTEETADFILRCNNFFDCLNGAHSYHHVRTGNDRLRPYISSEDGRFGELMDFLEYLKDWESQANNKAGKNRKAVAEKMQLAKETRQGIEMTVNGFIGATKYLLSKGTKYINARTFCQDPLEQYFSRQRASCGGSSNPNVSQFLSNQLKISVHREMSIHRRSGNTESGKKTFQLSDEPLEKRARYEPSKPAEREE